MLAVNFSRDINFESFITPEILEKYNEDSINVVNEISSSLIFSPEIIELDFDNKESKLEKTGPILTKLKNNNWVCIIKAEEVDNEVDEIEIFDPLVEDKSKAMRIPIEALKKQSSGIFITFNTLLLTQIDISNSALFCMIRVAKHLGVNIDLRDVKRKYVIENDKEVSPNLFRKIVADHNMKTKKIKLTWKKIQNLNEAFPMIIRLKDDSYAILCGIKKAMEEDEEDQLVLMLPENEKEGHPYTFWNEQDFKEKAAKDGYLLKKIYRLIDEERPFGILWYLPEFWKIRNVFSQIIIAVFCISAIALVTPLFFQIVVDKVLTHHSNTTLNILGIGILGALFFNSIMEFLRGYLLIFATNKIDIRTAVKTFRHLMKLPIDFFEKMPSGVLIKHMQQTEKIRGFLSGNLFFTILELITLIVFIPVLFLYSWQLTCVVLAFTLLMAMVILSLIKPFQSRLHELYNAEGKRQSMLVESIHGIKTVKSLSLEPVQEQRWNDSTAFAITRYFRVGKISLTARTISGFLEKAMVVAVIWIGALLVFKHEISIGSLIAFQMLSGRVTGPLVKIVSLIHEYQQTALSVKMLGNVMNAHPEPEGGGVRNPIKGNVAFDNISFQYTPDTPQVIKGLSIEIPSGGTVGIVGRSGSGKTTVTKLLQGLYNPQQGLIKIDGIDLREIDKTHLRTNIGVVLQENYFFTGTVRENISLTKKSASIEEIIYAAKLAGADEFVQKLVRGYDTMLEENAANLSGGQKQRLAIARALLTNPPILILDEATSALDPESEAIIQKNLKSIAKGRTVLIISHRLSIVHNADRILVMEDGMKESFEPPKDLLRKPGVYKDFWRQQMQIEEV